MGAKGSTEVERVSTAGYACRPNVDCFLHCNADATGHLFCDEFWWRLSMTSLQTAPPASGRALSRAMEHLKFGDGWLQVQGLQQQGVPHGQPVISSTMHGLANIVRQHGWAGLFRGLSINYMKVAPTTAIGFAVYDGMKGYLDLPRHM